MSSPTGPVLAAGALTWANQQLFENDQGQRLDLFAGTARIALATGLTAGLLTMVEKALPGMGTALGWALLVTVTFVRIDNRDTPVERALRLI